MKSGSRKDIRDKRNKGFRDAAAPSIITVLTLFGAIAGDAGRQALRFDRAGLAAGEFWRLLSAHLVHLGYTHTLLNLAGLAAIVLLIRGIGIAWHWWLVVGGCAALAIDAGLYWLQPGLHWYVGLSGVLHGYWAAAAIVLARAGERISGAVVAVLLAAKLAAEFRFGPGALSVALSGGPVVSEAHWYGMLGGAAGGLLALAWIRPGPATHAPL